MPRRLIALCGKPGAGKTTAAEILRDDYDYIIADDGLPLRQIAMKYLGLTHHQCFTQEGKLERVNLNGQMWQARGVLGEIGNAFEGKFGADVIPMMTHATLSPDLNYVMGSVRREQGFYWVRHGGICVEIDNPDVAPSPFEFDTYNKEAVTHVIRNDGVSIENLRESIANLMRSL